MGDELTLPPDELVLEACGEDSAGATLSLALTNVAELTGTE